MSAQNHGEKAGEGVKGVFKSINDVGESLRGNINGALDGFGDAITGNNRSHAHSSGFGHSSGSSGLGHSTRSTTSSVQNDSEKVRRDLNKGLDDAGKKVENFVHHHK
ncbi:hypothetical protein M409DRAFT_61669 [Zasmidium cellare ATCC 36951]|uniref:Uncharacterized protein n=1 Tax=Zasmidium cellare ATCC 36951 TaxID=1080233 RepID=A0A6A6BY03_ZASCE|nr:uncharacterized protein M409DRAFT_61669 [Zasmidium cellare ATCC 36951]KAF2158419.1 hypothetical protein M409DRAFT_61669 [Zasmidium cellare ATCC 36951]